MFEIDECAPKRELRIALDQVLHILHDAGGDAPGL